MKFPLLIFSLLVLTVAMISCQEQTTEKELIGTEKSNEKETPETEDQETGTEESEVENKETESEPKETENSETESDDKKPKGVKESEEKEKSSEKEDEIDLEDDPVPEPRCLARYNNRNCSDNQRKQAIAVYKAAREQFIQSLLNPTSQLINSNGSLSNNLTTTTIVVPNNSSQSIPSNSSQIASTISSYYCNRAIQLLANVDQYVRFNDSCEARVFGKRYNPDYWIKRCKKTLNRH